MKTKNTSSLENYVICSGVSGLLNGLCCSAGEIDDNLEAVEDATSELQQATETSQCRCAICVAQDA